MSSKTTAALFGAAPRPRLALVAGPQVAAGSQGPDSDAARTMAALGWCASFVDTVRLAVAGGLKADASGFRAVDADGRTGRRVKGERVRLLARCGYLARHASGLVVATEDGHEALRLAEAAGPGVLRDEADVMASVRKARRARQWDSHAEQDAHALPVLPGGGEERRRLAVARNGAERAAVEAEKTRKRTEALMRRARIRDRRKARSEAAREAERTAPRRCCRGVWPLDWRCGECRDLAARGIEDFPALPPGDSDSRTQQDHDNDTDGHTDMAGKRRITVKWITDGLWHATTCGEVYTVVHEDREAWPWVIVAPNGDRIGSPSVIDGEFFAEDVRDIVRRHTGGKPVPGLPADSERAADTAAAPEEAAGESAEGSDAAEAADVPASGDAYNTPTPARAVALDVRETKWVAECDRHGPVSMALNKYGDPVADVSAAYVYTSRDEADDAARLHLDRHAAQDADTMTPDDIDAAQLLNFSRDQWRALGWMREGKVRETADGFTAFDVSPDKADVSAKINKQRVPGLWLAGFVKVYAVAPGVRAFGLTDEGEAAFRLWSQAVRIGAVTEPEKDTKHTAVKDGPYRWLSAGDTWPGEAKAAQAAADAKAKAKAEAAALRKAEEERAALKAATPTDGELAVIDALGREGLDENAAAVLSAAYIGHVITRYRTGATSVRLDEGPNEDERHVSRTYNVNGVEKPITTEADDTLLAIPANLTDATADTWHALCTSVDERYGVYQLDLQAAMDAGRAVLAADEEPEAQESPELWAAREFVQTAEPGTHAEVIEWAGAGLLWQRGDGFGHAGRRVPAARVTPLIEAGTLYRSADGRVYLVKDAKAETTALVMVGGCCSCGTAVEFPRGESRPACTHNGSSGVTGSGAPGTS
ncbi:hypothetical protein FE633_17060 [Streptomyces montanus]|uniref:Uncharacterized protein n=1 Tax=Streptomyces montanus TaxID=2580423 RepID=A0A5R9FNF6_9ACTN|nr:hypothetical protein [Streptomyces montanus]TLS44861.1 hypothetical protein FE633_17060 [Streptomyces montanus]